MSDWVFTLGFVVKAALVALSASSAGRYLAAGHVPAGIGCRNSSTDEGLSHLVRRERRSETTYILGRSFGFVCAVLGAVASNNCISLLDR